MSWADMCEEDEYQGVLPTFNLPKISISPTVEKQPQELPKELPNLPEFTQQRRQIKNQHRIQTRNFRPRNNTNGPREALFRPREQQQQHQHQPKHENALKPASIWCVPMILGYFSQITTSEKETPEIIHAMLSTKLSLAALKNSIQTESIWPDLWRQVIEANWVLGRINQACFLKPFSRAFFKLVELNHLLGFVPPRAIENNNYSAICIGEAPGGFVHAISWCRSKCLTDGPWLFPDDPHRSFSVELVSLPEDTWPEQLNTPQARNHIHSFNLVKDTESRDLFCRKFLASADLVTADGGFEVPQDRRSEQELEMLPLITSEFEVAMQVLKPGGTLVLKFFAIDRPDTRLLLFRVFSCFENCSLCMPVASKPSNDERYIIARNFRGNSAEFSVSEGTIVLDDQWNRWFDYYAFEDKLRQKDPLSNALKLSRTMSSTTRFPLEPALGYAKAYCAELGLPVKQIFPINN